MFIELLAKRLFALVVNTGEHPVQGFLGGANRSHGMMNPSRAEASLDDFEAAAFA